MATTSDEDAAAAAAAAAAVVAVAVATYDSDSDSSKLLPQLQQPPPLLYTSVLAPISPSTCSTCLDSRIGASASAAAAADNAISPTSSVSVPVPVPPSRIGASVAAAADNAVSPTSSVSVPVPVLPSRIGAPAAAVDNVVVVATSSSILVPSSSVQSHTHPTLTSSSAAVISDVQASALNNKRPPTQKLLKLDTGIDVPLLQKDKISVVLANEHNEETVSKALQGATAAESKAKFARPRPSFLPLKPGTFVPKQNSLINISSALPLVSPETPRPKKSYGQLYLGGNAYTYLGLKCSTRMTFCTLTKSQPTYALLSPQYSKISMYSNWKVRSNSSPCVPGIDRGKSIGWYDSRHRQSPYAVAHIKTKDAVTHSSHWFKIPESEDENFKSGKEENSSRIVLNESEIDNALENAASKRLKICEGGIECSDDYTYVRGRGRGRYVCLECGIRCKKPSMLKKHIRTHTDVRPYTCKHCMFSFKTKGNLTKHMKSKTHYRKCVELGISPVPTTIDDSYIDETALAIHLQHENQGHEADDSEDEDDDDDDDDEDDDYNSESNLVVDETKNQLEREAVSSLLCLSEMTHRSIAEQYANAGLVSLTERPNTYPYQFCPIPSGPLSSTSRTPTLTSMTEEKQREKVSFNTGLAREFPPMLYMQQLVKQEEDNTGRYYFGTGSDNKKERMGVNESAEIKSGSFQGISPVSSVNSQHYETAISQNVATTTASSFPAKNFTTVSAFLPLHSTKSAAFIPSKGPLITLSVFPIDLSNKNTDSCTPEEEIAPNITPVGATPSQRVVNLTQTTNENCYRVENHVNLVDLSVVPLTSLSNKNVKVEAKTVKLVEPASPFCESFPKYASILEDGRSKCIICNKIFDKHSQLKLHVNIHYFEQPFRCESCVVSFRAKGHLDKHLTSSSHLNKVGTNLIAGLSPGDDDTKPSKCDDCNVGFHIHGNLVKDVHSKMHNIYASIKENGDESATSDTDLDTKITLLAPCPDVVVTVASLPSLNTTSMSSSFPPRDMTIPTISMQALAANSSSSTFPIDLSNKNTDSCSSEEEPTTNSIPNGMKPPSECLNLAPVGTEKCSRMDNNLNSAESAPSLPSPNKKLKAEFIPPSSGPSPKYASVLEDGRSKCVICNKIFSKPSQLRLHVNIHYFEQPFRCESCAVSFRTKGHLHKHLGSNSHLNKVSMNSTAGISSTNNPRPFKCDDCSVGFRIHGHLAKHLRSKMHIMKLECLGKLPFGTYAEMERCGINMNDIDTTDCENSLESLQRIAKGVVGGILSPTNIEELSCISAVAEMSPSF